MVPAEPATLPAVRRSKVSFTATGPPSCGRTVKFGAEVKVSAPVSVVVLAVTAGSVKVVPPSMVRDASVLPTVARLSAPPVFTVKSEPAAVPPVSSSSVPPVTTVAPV